MSTNPSDQLKAISLSKNVVRSIEAQSDLPPFELYPKAHRVTYRYYTGVLAFLQEDYTKVRRNKGVQHMSLTCNRRRKAYRKLGMRATLVLRRTSRKWSPCIEWLITDCGRLILTYLIPCRLITQHVVPKAPLLAESPRLERIFGPLVTCIKKGDLTGFDKALAEGEPEFVKRRIFLTLERSRDIALRNLLRKVYLAGGYDDLKEGQTEKDRIRKSRIPLVNFAAALRIGGQAVEDDEVECLLANQIYKVSCHNYRHSSPLTPSQGLMKGYISREHQMIVLNKKGAFPGTGV